MKTLKEQLDAIIQKYDLSNTQFYKAWMSGELTFDSLRTYASEYGNFIDLISLGWQSAGNQNYAREEVEHVKLWKRFAKKLDTDIQPEIQTKEVSDMCHVAKELFSDPVKALGALYSFEIQSPKTSKDKIEGLVNYGLKGDADAEIYFRAHLHNEHETDELLERMEALAPEDKAVALAACEQLSKSVFQALDGIYALQVK